MILIHIIYSIAVEEVCDIVCYRREEQTTDSHWMMVTLPAASLYIQFTPFFTTVTYVEGAGLFNLLQANSPLSSTLVAYKTSSSNKTRQKYY